MRKISSIIPIILLFAFLSGILTLSCSSSMSIIEEKDERFELVNEFKILTPRGYNPNTQLGNFVEKWDKNNELFSDSLKRFFISKHISNANFTKATKLEPGKLYTVKIFSIKEAVDSKECLSFIRKQNYFGTNAQGLSLVLEYYKHEVPDGITLSFDEKNSLFESLGDLWVPNISFAKSELIYRFNIMPFSDIKNIHDSWIVVDGEIYPLLIYIICFSD